MRSAFEAEGLARTMPEIRVNGLARAEAERIVTWITG
jgi:hypothetical protein